MGLGKTLQCISVIWWVGIQNLDHSVRLNNIILYVGYRKGAWTPPGSSVKGLGMTDPHSWMSLSQSLMSVFLHSFGLRRFTSEFHPMVTMRTEDQVNRTS